MSQTSLAFIGLGSNLNNPAQQIKSALSALSELSFCYGLQCAPWYSSLAIGPKGQPDYINTAAKINTSLTAIELLHQLQAIENQQGRQREIKWGARTLDLDLLLFDDLSLQSEELTLPHPEISKRSFVLLPLYDLIPSLIFNNGDKLEDLVKQCNKDDLTLITDQRISY